MHFSGCFEILSGACVYLMHHRSVSGAWDGSSQLPHFKFAHWSAVRVLRGFVVPATVLHLGLSYSRLASVLFDRLVGYAKFSGVECLRWAYYSRRRRRLRNSHSEVPYLLSAACEIHITSGAADPNPRVFGPQSSSRRCVLVCVDMILRYLADASKLTDPLAYDGM